MKIKLLAVIILLLLIACTPNRPTSTSTIGPLNQADSETQNSPPPANATPTPIPFPSPTPTFTPISLPAATPTVSSTVVSLKPRAEVIVTGLNVRQGPGLNYPIIDTVLAGDQLKVTGASPAGDWLQVVVGDVKPGWVSGHPTYVRLLAVSLAELPIVEPPLPPSSPSTQTAAIPSQAAGGLSGKLVFMTGSGGNLYVINVDGTSMRRLTGGVIDPALSPDGQHVAFIRWDGAKIGALHTINLDGSDERTIMGDIRRPKSPTWSPDGQQIIISFQHGGLANPTEECKEFDLDDGVDLSDEVGEITKFRVGQSGIVVCYIRRQDLQWGLRQVNVATGEFEDLPADNYSFNPAWDPHNPWRIIYDGNKGLVQLDITNGIRWPITTDLRDTGPVFSPDGRQLALTYKQHDHWETYTLNLESGQRLRLTKPPLLADPQYNSAAPAWSPAGDYLAFVTDRSGQWEIWLMNTDGSDQRPLFSPEIQAGLNLEYHGVNERMLNWAK